MLDQISNVYIGSNISSRLYSVNDLVWPDTTGNLWKVIDNPYNKTISNFNVTYIGGQVDVNWGTVISGNISSAANINHTFSGITRSGISVISKNGASITQINCGTSSPRLGGTVDISAFPNLQQFRCNNNDITALSGYAQNSNLTIVEFFQNKVTGTIPNLSGLTNLQVFRCDTNQLTGPIPSLSALTNLVTFYCYTNQLTGPIPSLSGLTNLQNFHCGNQLGETKLTGTIPSLSGLTNLRDFFCQINQLTGTIPSLSGLTNLRDFFCHTNQLTGTIPSLSGLTNLREFRCYTNQLTGPIPSLSGLTNLREFRCDTNQLTGTIPSLSGLTNLQIFSCGQNQLTGSIPSLSGLSNLQVFACQNQTGATKLTGSIPSLSGLSNLQIFQCNTNQLTGFAGGSIPNSLGDFRAENNLLTSSAVNAILAAFVAANKTTGTRILNLGGTGNAAPTGQGITDKATLISRGWTVTTN
jgi:Leucine-rich repeat (LRR) protein